MRPTVMLLAIMALVAALPPPFGFDAGTAAAASLRPHDPILIDGDADLCDAEDDRPESGDGIVNCATADGSAEKPYVVEGWRLSLFEEPQVCTDEAACPFASSCRDNMPEAASRASDTGANGPTAAFGGAFTICRTTKHVVVRNVEISVGPPGTRAGGSGTDEGSHCQTDKGCNLFFAGATVWGSSNVTLEAASIRAHGLAVFASDAVDADGRVWSADLRIRSSTLRGESRVDLAQAEALHTALVRALDADLTVEASEIDATGHLFGLLVAQDSEENAMQRFRLVDSAVTDALQHGFSIKGGAAEIEGNRFARNGIASFENRVPEAGLSGGVFVSGAGLLAGDDYRVAGNEFRMRGRGTYGLSIETSDTGLITFNRFLRDEASAGLVFAVTHAVGFQCDVRMPYNDFEGTFVANDATTCFLDARRSWWGDPAGPAKRDVFPLSQVQGRVTTDGFLKVPASSLSRVTVTGPATGTEVRGDLRLAGTATTSLENPLLRVEASLGSEAWDAPMVASGTGSWALALDTSRLPLGPFSLWFRGCGDLECGPSVRLDLVHSERPAAPVAVLRASETVVRAGALVTLDASASYSPGGLAIKDYRFRFGDGRLLDWKPEARSEVAYPGVGSYTAGVEVRDSEGVVSANLAEVVLRVVEAEPAEGLVSTESPGPDLDVPSPPLLLLFAALGAVAVALARRTVAP